MKTKLITTGFLALTLITNAQFSSTAPGGSQPQYNNAPIYINDHMVFNSPHGVIDWGSGTTGDLHFRTLVTQGNIWNYNDRMIIKNDGKVGIGTSYPAYRLEVESDDADMTNNPIFQNGALFEPTHMGSYSRYFALNKLGTHCAFFGHNNNNGTGNGGALVYGIGVFGKSERTENSVGNFQNTGVYGRAFGPNSTWNIGGVFYGNSWGLVGSKGTSTENSAAGANFGVWASAQGVNPTAGYFNGKTYSHEYYQNAESEMRQGVTPVYNTLDKLKKLHVFAYRYKLDEYNSLNLPEGEQFGLNVQEVEALFPNLVKSITDLSKNDVTSTESNVSSFKAINYTSLIPLLITGIQEQEKKIEALQAELAGLKGKNQMSTGINDQSSMEAGFTMLQNEPNPFTNETVVKYTLPETSQNAYMAVYDLTGKQITTIPVTEKGSASITLTSEKLAAGIYIYSIVADGKVIDSKRMIVAEK